MLIVEKITVVHPLSGNPDLMAIGVNDNPLDCLHRAMKKAVIVFRPDPVGKMNKHARFPSPPLPDGVDLPGFIHKGGGPDGCNDLVLKLSFHTPREFGFE